MGVALVDAPLIEVEHVSASFGAGLVLDDVHLTLPPGEIHGLLGENGSGKSTLIKILAGYHRPERGAVLRCRGDVAPFPADAGAARGLGMSFVHQDLGLVAGVSALENLRIDEFAAPRHRWFVNWKREAHIATTMCDQYGISLDLRAPLDSLSVTDRALVALVRGLGDTGNAEGHVIVLDEPTVYLPEGGRRTLFRTLRRVTGAGAAVLLVSHDLDEVLSETDRITVLRDGKVCARLKTSETSRVELVSAIVGSAWDADNTSRRATAAAASKPAEEAMLSLAHVSAHTLSDVSFSVRQGEVLGLTGLPGSGFDELLYVLFGVESSVGRLSIKNDTYDLERMSPRRAVDAGLALIPADRQGSGTVPSLTVRDNVMLPVLPEYVTYGRVNWHAVNMETQRLLNQFRVRPPEPDRVFDSLSGGNQQKAVLAKWFRTGAKVLLLHEPTQGVDIGARQQVWVLIRAAADNGLVVLCASSDHEQLAAICDRVLVFRNGQVDRELVGDELLKRTITAACLGEVT